MSKSQRANRNGRKVKRTQIEGKAGNPSILDFKDPALLAQFKDELTSFTSKISQTFPVGSPLNGLLTALKNRVPFGEAPLSNLSALGVPAWLTLYPVWMWWVHTMVAQDPTCSRFRKPNEWQKLVTLAQEFADNLRRVPALDQIPEEALDRDVLIRAAERWAKNLNDTPFVTNDYYIACGLNAATGMPFVRIVLKKRKGVGNKAKPVELDSALWIFLIWTWIKESSKQLGTEQACWADLVEVDRVFFNSSDKASTRIRNLENRIHRFKNAHDSTELAKLSNIVRDQAAALFAS